MQSPLAHPADRITDNASSHFALNPTSQPGRQRQRLGLSARMLHIFFF